MLMKSAVMATFFCHGCNRALDYEDLQRWYRSDVGWVKYHTDGCAPVES